MTAEEYAVAQAGISARLTAELSPYIRSLQGVQMNLNLWYRFLALIFPIVLRYRRESAQLGRFFYDSQRQIHHPDLPKHDLFLADYRLEWFVEAMEPARLEFSKPGASEYASERIALRAMKEVENGGRRTILRPITDPDERDQVVQGWARVATGRETCGFCMMLVSRGPVYLSARGAGLNLGDTAAQDLLQEGTPEEIAAVTRRFHEGCDCKIVPVFDKADWPGRDAYLRARKIWNENTRGYRGQDAVNAFRRAIERGGVDIQAMSIAA